MTVYLAHAPNISSDGKIPDFSDASRFGEIVTVLQAGEHPAMSPDFCARKIKDRLSNFDPRTDHILWVRGDSLALMLIALELLSQGNTHFSWLRYSRKLDEDNNRTNVGEYFPMRVSLEPYLYLLDQRPPL